VTPFAPGLDRMPASSPCRSRQRRCAMSRIDIGTKNSITCGSQQLIRPCAVSRVQAEKSMPVGERDPDHGPADPGGDRAGLLSPWGHYREALADSHGAADSSPRHQRRARAPNGREVLQMGRTATPLRWIWSAVRTEARVIYLGVLFGHWPS